MTKLVKYIDKDGDIDILEISSDDELKNISNVIEISENKPIWKIDKPTYKVTYSYDEFAYHPIKDVFTTNELVLAICKNAQFRYNIGNYDYEDLCQDYNYDYDDYDTPKKLIRKLNKTGYCNYVSVHDHSLHTYFLGYSRGWDNSTIGLIYIPYSTTNEGENLARDLLKDITGWANGECYRADIEQLTNGEWMEIDSSGTYFDYWELKEITKSEIAEKTKNDTDPLIITVDIH